jgi:hypothetical protein
MAGADLVRLRENQVAELKELEERVTGLFRRGQVQESDLDIVEYYRLEAEESLGRAKAENGEPR